MTWNFADCVLLSNTCRLCKLRAEAGYQQTISGKLGRFALGNRHFVWNLPLLRVVFAVLLRILPPFLRLLTANSFQNFPTNSFQNLPAALLWNLLLSMFGNSWSAILLRAFPLFLRFVTVISLRNLPLFYRLQLPLPYGTCSLRRLARSWCAIWLRYLPSFSAFCNRHFVTELASCLCGFAVQRWYGSKLPLCFAYRVNAARDVLCFRSFGKRCFLVSLFTYLVPFHVV